MSEKEEIEIFKNELRNYAFYKRRIKSLSDMVEMLFHELSGVKAIQYDKEPIHTPPNEEIKYRIMEEIEHHERNKARAQSKLDDIDKILNHIETPLYEAIIDVYANKIKMYKVANKLGYSKNGLAYQMNKAIKKALRTEKELEYDH